MFSVYSNSTKTAYNFGEHYRATAKELAASIPSTTSQRLDVAPIRPLSFPSADGSVGWAGDV
jgi:hypothetical protein